MTVKWKIIGARLGLSPSDLDVIEADNARTENRSMDMLVHWLRSGEATKQALQKAMKKED